MWKFVYLKYVFKRTFLSTFREFNKRKRTQRKKMNDDEMWSFVLYRKRMLSGFKGMSTASEIQSRWISRSKSVLVCVLYSSQICCSRILSQASKSYDLGHRWKRFPKKKEQFLAIQADFLSWCCILTLIIPSKKKKICLPKILNISIETSFHSPEFPSFFFSCF